MKRFVEWLERHHILAICIYVIILTAAYATISLLQHWRFESYGYDLGIFDQAVWRFSRFLSMYNTVKERVILVDHLSFTLPLLAPLYWLWSDVRMLLLFQAFWLSFSSLAVYLIARRRSKSSIIAFGITLSYGLFYGMQIAVYYNFHPSIIGVGLVPWIGYFLEYNKRRLMWIAVALLILTQENMGITLFGVACFYIINRKYRSTMVRWMVIGVLYTLITPWILEHLSVRGFEFAPTLPSHITGYVTQFFDDQNKREVWLRSFASFGFLPLFSPAAVVAVTIDLFQYFLSGPEYVRNWTPYTHHRAMLSILLSLGALDVISRFKNRNVRILLTVYLVGSAILSQYLWRLPIFELGNPSRWKSEQWMSDIREVLRYVPKDEAVAAQNSIVPHISQRKEAFVIWPGTIPATDPLCKPLRPYGGKGCWWLDVSYKPSLIVIDIRPNQDFASILETSEHVQEAIQNMEKRNVLRLRYASGSARLYDVIRPNTL